MWGQIIVWICRSSQLWGALTGRFWFRCRAAASLSALILLPQLQLAAVCNKKNPPKCHLTSQRHVGDKPRNTVEHSAGGGFIRWTPSRLLMTDYVDLKLMFLIDECFYWCHLHSWRLWLIIFYMKAVSSGFNIIW